MNNLNAYPEIYMPCPFAGEADNGGTEGRNRSKQFSDSKSNANVNMRTGFPSVFTLAQSANGKYLSRPDMNQLGYLATVGQFRRQIGCLNEFNSTFAGTLNGYAKGAVLDYVVKFNTSLDSPIKEVWKIVSLKENNKDEPSSSNIADFNTENEKLGTKSWLRLVPDAAYLSALEGRCNSYTDKEVSKEKTRAEGVEAQKISTSTANKQFAATRETRTNYQETKDNEKFRIDGTARDKDGAEVDANVCVPDPGKTETAFNSTLGRDVNIARYGHVHTNMYTKAEVDAKIQSMGGMYAAGSDQDTGYHDGTYRNVGGTVKGHKHDESAECFRSINFSSGNITFHPHDGTAHDSNGNVTNSEGSAASGHVHTNYATTEYVDTKSSSNKMFVSSSVQSYNDGAKHTVQKDCFLVIAMFGDDSGYQSHFITINNGGKILFGPDGDYASGAFLYHLCLPCKKGTVIEIGNSTIWIDHGSIWTEIGLVA